MDVTVLSGGSGSDSLIKGLVQVGGKEVKITNLINLYDDGKSTGFCRKVMNVLGPSDLRKVQYSQWCADGNRSDAITELYESRPDLTFNNFVNTCEYIVNNLPRSYEKTIFKNCIMIFNKHLTKYFNDNNIEDDESRNACLESFNVANVIYSTLFKTHGISKTIKIFRSFLKIEHNVVVNSYTNSILTANCKNGYICKCESDIVELNGKDTITNINIDPNPTTNIEALDCIAKCDMIVISCGTPFSSILPTLKTLNIGHEINKSKARKIIIMNNEYDTDSIGFSSDDIITLYRKYIDFNNFDILVNADASESHRKPIDRFTHNHIFEMGKGEHRPISIGFGVFSIYFDINSTILNHYSYAFDFDGTLYDNEHTKISEDNLTLLQKLRFKHTINIVSGNSYEHIMNCGNGCSGNGYILNGIIVWADGANNEYKNGKLISSISDESIHIDIIDKLIEFCIENDLFFEIRGQRKVFTIKCPRGGRQLIKRDIPNVGLCHIRFNGKSSIDISIDNPDKDMLYKQQQFETLLYVGDSPDGNDRNMMERSAHSITIDSVSKTNVLLNYLTTG